MNPRIRCTAVVALLGAAASHSLPANDTADLVIREAHIYTVDSAHSLAQALAVRDGRIVFVGSDREVQRWVGPRTRVEALGGRLVLPGLVDAHIHPLDIVDLDVCDLKSLPMPLKKLSAFVAQCLARYQTPPGGVLRVHEWNYTDGNEPDPQHPTLRAALDAASTTRQIQLMGNDGHHDAFNSLALAQARNAAGKAVGLSRATLASDFAAYRTLVGVDQSGEPNGAVNEEARYLGNEGSMLYEDLDEVVKAPERITQRLNSVGITAILDAMAAPEGMPVYDKLVADGNLTVRVTLAQFFDPDRIRTADGRVDYDSMLKQANAIRAKYAHSALIRADVVKIFADGVIEGNPYAVPPTLPEGAMLRPYLQPKFGIDAHGKATVRGYIDTSSALCAEVRRNPQAYSDSEAVGTFMSRNGFHPAQCTVSDGRLQHPREVILEYARRMHVAGFSLHIHAIGDRATRTAIDAIEAARAADGIATTHDALAHLQLADPTDVARIGRDRIYIAFTYAWMDTDPEYDLTVIPFIERVSGSSYAALHAPGSFYEANAYPVRSVKAAGGILVAGSDAPVETRDPRPFVNMAFAVTRSLPRQPPLGPAERITLREVIDAYTINGAQMLNLATEAGSLEVGKSADFVVLDRDILALADSGHPEAVADTQVVSTWFRGKRVYARSH
ncbi:MAG TPA: amidohydrolase family protein [Steroidobacteraceae bacterium]|nr:amidohydrolase family protein [Steroidobacteraceae bacterium]